jgi:hypothetical protein
MSIVGYYHVCAINNYRQIVEDQIKVLKASGLFEATSHINVSILTEHDDALNLFSDPKFRIRVRSSNLQIYERQILNCMLDDSKEATAKGQEFYIWYIHSKGVSTRHQNPTMIKRIFNWRKLLEAFVIWNWQSCLNKISQENFDTSSANYFSNPDHYSGNFWWSRSRYISKLPVLPPTGHYVDPEMWLCRAKPNVHSFYSTEVRKWCYDKDYIMPDLKKMGLKVPSI